MTIETRQRADQGAYGGLYIYGGGRNVIQLGLGQGEGREGLMVQLDNHSSQLRQTFYPEIGTKQQWREYRVEVDRDRVTVAVDGEEVVSSTFSGWPLDRLAIWNGMNSLGAIEADWLRVTWHRDQPAPVAMSFSDDFTDAETLGEWSSYSGIPQWRIVEDAGAEDGMALHWGFRRQGRWTLLQQTPISLQPRTQYRLTMRLRGESGVMGVRLSVRRIGASHTLARIDSRQTGGYVDRTATFVTGSEPGICRLMLEGVWGGGRGCVDRVELAPADAFVDPYETGVNVLHTTLGDEFDLGVLEVDDDFELVVSHRYPNADNPGLPRPRALSAAAG